LKRLTITALVFALATSALLGSRANADRNLYRWTDERGNQVNSDRPPPPGIDYEVISTSSSMVRKVDPEEGAVPAKVKPAPGNQFDPVNTSKPVIEKNPEYCARARDNLAQLDTRARIRIRNEQGEVRFLTEAERAGERDKAISAIEAYCE
jgi:hypothetical protein